MKNIVLSFIRNDEGQDLIEYALLAGFISLAAVAAIGLIGDELDDLYRAVLLQLQNAQA